MRRREPALIFCRAAAAGIFVLTPTLLAAAERPLVFAGIPPLRYVVERLAGEHVDVGVLLPPGASPHTYEPTPRQLTHLDRATLYLRIGVPFEGPVLAKVRSVMPDLEVVDCRAGIELVPMGDDGHRHAEEHYDPHIWLDADRMEHVAANIAAALSRIVPSHAGEIDKRLGELRRVIEQADARAARMLAPVRGRAMVVVHPAYGYFARRYGLQQLAVEVEGKSPSARQLAVIVDTLRTHAVRTIFVQPQFSKTSAQRVSEAVGCSIVELDPLAEDYPANLELMAGRVAAGLEN